MQILVTGSTGYIGGRLVPRLIDQGHQLTVLVRDVERIMQRSWYPQVTAVPGDLLNSDSLKSLGGQAFDAAYYLVHSMTEGHEFRNLDNQAAENFVNLAKKIQHVIYLGGLLPKSSEISEHLTSRAETGSILAKHLPVTEFRAGPVIGSGSASFEIVRYLVERLPIILAPHWVKNEVQPIAVRDILSYLIAALHKPALGIVEVGVSEAETFRSMLLEYARVKGLRRWVKSIPLMNLEIAARWVGQLTPIHNNVAIPLMEGIIHPVVANTEKALREFPEVKPINYETAVRYALDKISHHNVETRWSGALGEGPTYHLVDWEGTIREERTIHVYAEPSAVFETLCSLGGDKGWLVWNWAWRIRGWLDRLCGGPGLRRGRRDSKELLLGETVDFWRVEEIQENRILRLRAEMKVPGEAWLQFEIWPEGKGSRLVQSAIFRPMGLLGVAYWYSLYPIHKYIFSAMIRAIRKDCGGKK